MCDTDSIPGAVRILVQLSLY